MSDVLEGGDPRGGEVGLLRTVIVKRGATPRLRHEADMLRLARHPGVVEMIDLENHGDDSILTMRCAGERNLGALGGLPIEVIAGVTAAVAEILADLHRLEITHGRISVDHIVIDALGRPVICGWAEGDHRSPGVGQLATRNKDRRRPTSDVADLGTLILGLLGSAEPTMPGRHHRSHRHDHREALASLASRASAPDSSTRPSARALASAIGEVVPGARLPAPAEQPLLAPSDNRSEPLASDPAIADPFHQLRQTTSFDVGHRMPVGALTAVVTLLVLVSVATFAVLRVATGGDGRPDGSMDLAAPSPARNVSPATTSPGIDDGDASGAGRLASAKPIIEHAGHRFEVGEAGDRVITLATRCTNAPAVVLQRPATGEVFVFEDWAEVGPAVEATAVARLPADAEPEAIVSTSPDHDRCEVLRAVTRDGSGIDVPLTPAPRTEDAKP